MFKLVENSLHDFKLSYRKYLSFAFIYMLLTSVIFVPFISYIFNQMLHMMGTGALINSDIYQIGVNKTGIFGMLLISFIAIFILFIEFGVLIIFAQKHYFNKDVLIAEALLTALKKIPLLIGFGIFQFLPVLLLSIPFIDSPLFAVLLDFNLPIFLTSTFSESNFFVFLYILVVSGVIYLFIRSMFTLHYIFLEEKSVWRAIRSSFAMTRKNIVKVLLTLVIINIAIYGVGFLVMTILSELISLLEAKLIGDYLENYLTTFISYMTVVSSLLLIPLNIIIITRLFYLFKKDQVHRIEDQLILEKNHKLNKLEKDLSCFLVNRKYIVLTIVIGYVTVLFFVNDTVQDRLVYLKWDVEVASHRGDLRNAPENSISSIRSAIDKGVDAVEIDVMTTKDGVVILNHDYDLARIAGVPSKVSEMTYEEIAEIDIGILYSEEFQGEKIPTLDEVLQLMKGTDVKLIIDLKSEGYGKLLAEKVVELIEKHEMEHQSYVQAFDYELLQVIRDKNSEITIGQILYLSAGNLAELDVDFYTIRQTMLTERFIRNAQKQNREVWVWTVNMERNMKEVLKYDIDGIITDYPEKLYQIVELDLSKEPRTD